MKPVQTIFDFPKAEERYLLRGVQSYEGLKRILLGLKRSPEYEKHEISYSIREWKRCNNRPAKHLSVYFTCCNSKNSPRPSIHFVSRNEHKFILEDKSTYTHHHQETRKMKPTKRKYPKFIEKIIQDQDFVDSQEESRKQDQSEVVHEEYAEKMLESDKQSQEKSESQEGSQEIVEQIYTSRRNQQKIFDFPSQDLLEKIHITTSVAAIKNKLNHFIRLKAFQSWGIRHQGTLESSINQHGKKVNQIVVEFKCCTVGTENQRPYLLFVESQPSLFHLKEYKNLHDHRDIRVRRKYPVISESKKLEFKQIKDEKKRQKNILRRDCFSNIMHENKQITNENKNPQSSNQLQQKQIRSHHQFKDERYENSNLDRIQKQIESNFISNNNNFPNKDQVQVKTHRQENSHRFSGYKRKQKNQKIVIELISQSEDDNKIQKTKAIKKLKQSTQKAKRKNHKSDSQKPKQVEKNKLAQQINLDYIVSKDNFNTFGSDTGSQMRGQVFSWFQRYNKQISSFLIEKKWKNKKIMKSFKKQIQRSFSEYFPQHLVNKNLIQQFWNECIFEMLQWNNIENLKLPNLKMSQNGKKHFQFQKRIFVKRIEDIYLFPHRRGGRQKQQIVIYLTVYPIPVANEFQQLNICIAYTLTYDLQPHMLWFYIYKNTQKQRSTLQDILNEHHQQNKLYEALKESVQFFQFKKVNFIYTTLDYQLINVLDKVCQQNFSQNPESKFSSTIHLSCVEAIFTAQGITKDSQLGNEIGNRIKNSPKFTKIKDSCNVLKSFFNKENDPQINQNKILINPRVIYENYKTFSEPFSVGNQQQNYYSRSMAFFQSEILNNQQQKLTINDPVSQLNSVFSQYTQFNDIAEVFMLVIKFFDPKFRNFIKMAHKTQMVSRQSYQVQKQCNYFNRTVSLNMQLKYSIQNIFAQPTHEMLEIVRKCPSFIIKTIHKLIIAANQLALKNQNKPYKQDKNLYIYQDIIQTQKKFSVEQFYDDLPMKYFFVKYRCSKYENISLVNEKCKKWKCSCNFYKQTGIPCEHEILTALKNKDSLFNEIHSRCKIKQK